MVKLKSCPAWLVLIVVALCWSSDAIAACSGSSPNRTAASASRSDVNDCISAASSGDTIRVPAGSATWSSPIELPSNKDLVLMGASVITCSGQPITCTSVNNTNITCGNSGICFAIDLAVAIRITGFTILGASEGGIASDNNNNQNPSKYFRIDHNRIVSNSGWGPMEFTGSTNGVHPQGLVDNNSFVDISIHANGTNYGLDEGNYQHILWTQQSILGTNGGIIYIEDNHFQNTSNNINNADSNYGGRYVYRFNNTTSGRQGAEFHSVQGFNRAGQRFEIYKNTGANPSGWSGVTFLRGGTGVVFGNRLIGSSWGFGVIMDNVRSEGDPGGGVGRCNGSSNWDQNTSGQSGYACRDQIGRAYDTELWAPGRPYKQVLQPAYFWDNTQSSGSFQYDNSGLSTWIKENRDYYRTNSSFNGTTGVGEGPISNRPSSCTVGVAYWATDQGEWNSRNPGPDGQLYRCTATNSWSLFYVPYTYPHPLQGSGGGTPQPPTPHTNLSAVVQ
jgi:hypothetical protein